jgi:hypothetical protein
MRSVLIPQLQTTHRVIEQYALLRNRTTSNQSVSANSTWLQRPINEIAADEYGIVEQLASGKFTLRTGHYRVKARGQSMQTIRCHIRLWETRESRLLVAGTARYSINVLDNSGDYTTSPLEVCGEFDVWGNNAVELQQWCELSSGGGWEFGISVGGDVMNTVELWRVGT